MQSDPALSHASRFLPSSDSVILWLQNSLVLLLYLFLLWCSWRFYRLGQFLSRRTASATSADEKSAAGDTEGHLGEDQHKDPLDASSRGDSDNKDGEDQTAETTARKAPGDLSALATTVVGTTEVQVRARGPYGTSDTPKPPPATGAPLDKRRATTPIVGRLTRARAWLRAFVVRYCCCCCWASRASSAPPLAATRKRNRCVARARVLWRSLPAIPPVLFLLLTGVLAREVLELVNYHQSVSRLWEDMDLQQQQQLQAHEETGERSVIAAVALTHDMAHHEEPRVRVASSAVWSPSSIADGASMAATAPKRAATTASSSALDNPARRVNLVERLLVVSQPFLLLGLATIGLDIGSHLAYPQLSLVKKQLSLFLLCFFPVVFVAMTLVFRVAGARLLHSSERGAWFSASLRVVVTEGDFDTAPPPSEAAMLETANRFFARYESTALWCFALVMACITLERSSPEFINAIYSTGARGVLPSFTLCVTACQDIFALVLFVLVSSSVRPRQVDGARMLLASVRAVAAHTMQEGNRRASKRVEADMNMSSAFLFGRAANATASFAEGEEEEEEELIAQQGFPLPKLSEGAEVSSGEEGAAKELLLIAMATLGATITALLLRKAFLFVLRRVEARILRRRAAASRTRADERLVADHGHNADTVSDHVTAVPIAHDADTHATDKNEMSREQAEPVAYAAFGLLALLTGTLALWAATTPCELLLAAVLTGSGANFFVSCPLLHLSVGALNELTNVVLFTTMGMRTRFSSYTVPTAAELLATTMTTATSKGSFPAAAAGAADAALLDGRKAFRDNVSIAAMLVPKLPSPVGPASFPSIALYGVFFFVARVIFLWLGGFVGATVAGVERLANQYVTPPSREDTTPASTIAATNSKNNNNNTAVATAAASPPPSSGRHVDAVPTPSMAARLTTARSDPDRPAVKPIVGVRYWIGFALITQLAIALTLNARGGEEYKQRMMVGLSAQAAAVSPHGAMKASGAAQVRAQALQSLLSPAHLMLSMAPLVQAYTISIALAMVSGPVLGAWVLRKSTRHHK